ncbi:lytic murein transglycosylase [Pseudochrobactrum saccharolyticum]|uniref:Lytic murein transglycosylase n=1 Tax=Pseudochrobactrum saccharolyticum TaxID=354352 RepID=A0A7W8EPG6_9HYPH|nr:lytic murein transglycosylase [Pseudochrobactrum saccharolyticum]KAB0540722.1 lytic murein transglycosylase [Pseudochrobactrum saccharolyticum]MBB5090302.1 lytic murein transglycosylase [Pseudochrobactrum saccharolyticum]
MQKTFLRQALVALSLFCAAVPLTSTVAQAQTYSAALQSKTNAAFQQWLENDLWPQAQQRGISRSVFNQSLSGVQLNWKLPDLVPPGTKPQTPKQQTQSEFGSPANYFRKGTVDSVVSNGKVKLNAHKSLLAKIERDFGVPAGIVVAVWGRESAFGSVKIPYNGFEVLATKAFMATRKDMFRAELLAALEIVQKGYMDSAHLKSSWAGALGQPQFMPTSYLEHAVDYDGDGRRDIWNSVPDTLASIAAYLQHFGWQKGRDWGFEVNVPQNVSCSLEGPDQGKSFKDWSALGVTRVNGKAFPSQEMGQEGFLLMPAGRHGPAFIVTQNFYVLKNYNMSDLYALFIGHVSDRMSYGAGGFQQGWGAVGGLYRSDVAAMQKRLQKQGYDVGKPDGLAGFKTRRSIGVWQAKNGQPATCFPDKALVKAIR